MIPLPRITNTPTLLALAQTGKDYQHWYAEAHDQIKQHAPCEWRAFADLLSLFSPRVSVLRSVKWAVHYARYQEFLHDCPQNIQASVYHWVRTGEIRGPKTKPFALALKGEKDVLVLDTWMAKAMNVNPKRWEVKRVWEAGRRRMESVRSQLDVPMVEAQAMVWAGQVIGSGRRVPVLDLSKVVA